MISRAEVDEQMTAAQRTRAALRRLGKNSQSAGRRLPLASMRAAAQSAAGETTGWKLEPDGILGRALQMRAGASITYPLTLSGPLTFTATALLYPHDWRDRAGVLRATVAVSTPDGVQELWSQTLRTGDRGPARGRQCQVAVPATATALHLAISPLRDPPPDAVEQAVWLEPALWDPEWPADHTPTPAAAEPSAAGDDRHAGDGPLFSVLVPVHNPPLQMLREAIESVQAQTFPDWELCLHDDGSSDPEVTATLRRYRDADPRIRVHHHSTPRGISAATNAAMELASGAYIALLDHDDTLAPDALERIAQTIAADPGLDMVYSDEDVVSDGVVLEPHPKPGWSPDHMAAVMYTCHLGVYRRSLVHQIGAFRSELDGCQDFDLVLRLMERTDRVAHVPGFLYHWRAHAASTATFGGDAKPHAFLAQPRAIGEHLDRTEVDAEIRFGSLPGIHQIVHRVDPATRVAIVLATDDIDGLQLAARTWVGQPHPAWHLVIATPPALADASRGALRHAGITEDRITHLATDLPSAAALRDAAEHGVAHADHLLLLQSPVAGLTRDWLTRLLGYSRQPAIAAAGPVLLAADGHIDNAGIALPEGIPLYLLNGLPSVAAPPAVVNVSALSGALITRSSTYLELGGLDPARRDLTLIDLCLRARTHGRRIVAVPDARLKICGRDPTTNDLPGWRALHSRWLAEHNGDPYFNAAYLTDRGDAAMRTAVARGR